MRVSELPSGDPVVFDLFGSPMSMQLAGEAEPARVLLEPVTDALKVVTEDRVVASFDRQLAGAVVGFALARVVVDRLDVEDVTPEALLQMVANLGYRWSVIQVEPERRPFSAQ